MQDILSSMVIAGQIAVLLGDSSATYGLGPGEGFRDLPPLRISLGAGQFWSKYLSGRSLTSLRHFGSY